MIFVWGKSTERKELSKGHFYCPTCTSVQKFTLSEDVYGSHIYDIQITEDEKSEKYVKCDSCFTAYKLDVLFLNEQGVLDTKSKFVPLSQQNSLYELFEKCSNYETLIKKNSPSSADFIAIGLYVFIGWVLTGVGLSAIFPRLNEDILAAIIICVILALLFVFITITEKKYRIKISECYQTEIKGQLIADIEKSGVPIDDFWYMLKNDETLTRLSQQYCNKQ